MTYRELLELYKKSELDENKIIEVEADIEKQEAISDYLYEKAELPGLKESLDQGLPMSDETGPDFSRAQEFSKIVNKSIQRAFIKMGVATFLVVLAVVLFIQFALPHIVSCFYYNPGQKIAENTNRISLDMAVYTELAIPGYYRDNVTVEEKGYGNYEICIYQSVSYNRTFTNLSGKIEKGKLVLYDINLLKRPIGNIFAWFQARGDSSDSLRELAARGQTTISNIAGSPAYATELLKELPENTNYVAYVTLDRMMKYKDFVSFINDRELANVWCAVCTNGGNSINGGDAMFRADNIGFMCTLSQSNLFNWDREKYPNLQLWDSTAMDSVEKVEGLEEDIKKEDFMKTHFTSMLYYLADQEQFLAMMEEDREQLLSAADYVENNGLTVYGFTTVAEKDVLLKLNEEEEVYEIYALPLK